MWQSKKKLLNTFLWSYSLPPPLVGKTNNNKKWHSQVICNDPQCCTLWNVSVLLNRQHHSFDPWTVAGRLVDEQPWSAWSWACPCWWVGKAKGVVVGEVEGEGSFGGGQGSRGWEGVWDAGVYTETYGKRQTAGDPSPLLAALPSSPAAEEAGPTSRVGFMIRRKTKRVRESEGKHVFSPGTPAAARQWFMLFSELRDLKMLHLIKRTERGANVKDVPHEALQFWSLYHTLWAVGMEEQSDL